MDYIHINENVIKKVIWEEVFIFYSVKTECRKVLKIVQITK